MGEEAESEEVWGGQTHPRSGPREAAPGICLPTWQASSRCPSGVVFVTEK